MKNASAKMVEIASEKPGDKVAEAEDNDNKMDISALMNLLEHKRGKNAPRKKARKKKKSSRKKEDDEVVTTVRIKSFFKECYVVTKRDVLLAAGVVIAILALNNALYLFEDDGAPEAAAKEEYVPMPADEEVAKSELLDIIRKH